MRFSIIDFLEAQAPLINIADVGAMWVNPSDVPYPNLLVPGKFRVAGFEPQQAECDKLNAMKMPGCVYLPYVIGDGSERTFYECNYPMTSSMYKPNTRLLRMFQTLAEVTTPVKETRVTTRRLDDIPEVFPCDFLKVDVQGAELDVLRGGPRLLEQALVVQIEVEFVPMYEGQPLFADVDAELRSRGFLLHALLGQQGRVFKPLQVGEDIHKGLNQALWAEAFYVRDFTKFDQLNPEQLLKIAVLVQELINSADLAGVALLHHDQKTGENLWHSFMRALVGGEPPAPPPL